MGVKITDSDIILLGHGSYSGGFDNIILGDQFQLIVLQPLGFSLKVRVAKAMINQVEIPKIYLHTKNGSSETVTNMDAPVATYSGKSPKPNTPNLTLYPLEGDLLNWALNTIGDKENVVLVKDETMLSDLVNTNEKILAAQKALPTGSRLNLYWAACADQIDGNYADLQ